MTRSPRFLAGFLLALFLFSPLTRSAYSDSASERITESFSGQGGRGPYYLAWRGFPAGSERVSLNGLRVFRDQDYLLDAASGMLAFVHPIRPSDTILVEYAKGQAQANAANAFAPSVSLLDNGSTQFRASYLFNPPASGVNGAQAQVGAVGLGGTTKGRNWSLNSNFLLGTQGESFNRRAGYQFGGEYGLGAFKLTGAFSRAGEDFNLAPNAGLQQGVRNQSLGLAFNPSKRFQFSTSYQSSAGLASTAGGTSTLQNALTLKPSDATTFTASSEAKKTSAGADDQTVRTDTLRLDQKLSPKTSASLQRQTVHSGDDATDTNSVGVTTQLIPGTDLSTNVYQKITKPGDGAEKRQESGIQTQLATQAGALQIQTNLNQTQSDAQKQSAAGVNVATKNGVVKVQGNLSQTQQGDASQNQTDAHVELKPLKPVTLSAGVSQTAAKTPGDSSAASGTASQQYGIDYKPSAALSLSAQLQTSVANDENSDVTAFTAAVTPARFLQLSGALKQRSASADDQPNADTYNAQVSLTPLKNWKLTGGYAENPESQDQIQPVAQKQLGMETTLGSLLLNGGYALEDRLNGIDAGSRTMNLGIGYRFSSATQLQLTFKQINGFGDGYSDQKLYGLSFSRNLGDAFTLSLQGEASDAGGPSDSTRTYTGSANLGVRF